jgi:hypothetical protein
MWNKQEKKTIFTLCIDNYAPELTELTFPLMFNYAKKIGAEFFIIKERQFPSFPAAYEKLQIYQLAQEMKNDWNIFFDADTLIAPTMPDITSLLSKDTVLHNGNDFAPVRWKYDRFFKRDGRHIGSCNWCAVASDWCIELWKPLDDLSLEEAKQNIFPTAKELNCGIVDPAHLLDDYTLSRNIAKYGLKFTTFMDLQMKHLKGMGDFLWHIYTVPNQQKLVEMQKVLNAWGLL